MTYAGPSPFAGPVPFAGAVIAAGATPIPAPFGGPRPFAGPAPFAGAAMFADGESPPTPPTTLVASTDSASAADGTKAQAGGSFGLFDAFTGAYGALLESHAPTGGSGAWAKHPSYASGSLSIGGYGGDRLARNNAIAATSVYMTDAGTSGADVRASWTQGDDEVVYVADSRCGVGLRVDPAADAGYYAIAHNDDASGVYEWRIVKRLAGVDAVLASAPKPSLVLSPTSLEFTAVGSVLTFRVAGSTVATATDSAIPGPGRYAVAFRPTSGEGAAAGTWIDDLWLGPIAAATRLAPERVSAFVAAAEAAGWAGAWRLVVSAASTASIASADRLGASDAGRIASTLRAGDSSAPFELASMLVGLRVAEATPAADGVSSLSARAGAADAVGCGDSPLVFATLAARDSSAAADLAVVVLGPAGIVAVFGVDSSEAVESASVLASLRSRDDSGWTERSFAAVGLLARDSAGWGEAWAVRTIVATLSFAIYRDSGSGTPIDYETPVAHTTTFSWTSPPLGRPGVWSFGVRASDLGGEEKNLDAAVTIRLDAAGVDVSRIPDAPTSLRAFPRKGGVIRLEWHSATFDRSRRPTGFRIYAGSPAVDYGAPATTVPHDGRAVLSADLAGLADGVLYELAVRAYNAAGESPGAAVASCRADAAGPPPVAGLTLTPAATEPT